MHITYKISKNKKNTIIHINFKNLNSLKFFHKHKKLISNII